MKRRRNFGPRAPTKAELGVALRSLLITRDKPMTAADKESIARSHGVRVEHVEKAAGEVEQQRAHMEARA